MGCVGGKSASAAVVADCNKQNMLVLSRGWKDRVFWRGNSFWLKAISKSTISNICDNKIIINHIIKTEMTKYKWK